jgi:hypothetical protein
MQTTNHHKKQFLNKCSIYDHVMVKLKRGLNKDLKLWEFFQRKNWDKSISFLIAFPKVFEIHLSNVCNIFACKIVGSYHYIDPHRFYKYLVWKNLCVKINLGSLFWKSQITWNRSGYQDNIFRKLIIAFFNERTQGHKDLLIHNFVQHTSIFYTQTHIYASKSVMPQNRHLADYSNHATIYMVSLWKRTTKRLVHVGACTWCGWNRVAIVTQVHDGTHKRI